MITFCVVLAAPRSGTTSLGEGVAKIFDIQWLGEIFHRDFADPTIELNLESVIGTFDITSAGAERHEAHFLWIDMNFNFAATVALLS